MRAIVQVVEDVDLDSSEASRKTLESQGLESLVIGQSYACNVFLVTTVLLQARQFLARKATLVEDHLEQITAKQLEGDPEE